MSVVHDTFRLERTYPAAASRVFAAWASQAAKAQWFGPDHDDSGAVPVTEEHSLDFRVGGRERITGAIPNGPRFEYDAVYADIVDNSRLIWSYDMHLDGRRISVSVATLELSGVPGGTQLVLTEQGAYLDGLDTNDQRRQGTEDLLDKLGEFVRR
jgi:uncharacterized protein YndB with AHSA1/START domain